jgi:hypothetical protein
MGFKYFVFSLYPIFTLQPKFNFSAIARIRAHHGSCLEHQICMLAHLRAFPNLFLDYSVLGLVYRREFLIDSKHGGEEQVSHHSGGVSEINSEH